MSYKTARTFGLLSLAVIFLLISALSFGFMQYNAQRLEAVVTIEENKFRRWQQAGDVIAGARDGLYRYHAGRLDTLDPVLEHIETALTVVTHIRDTAHEAEERADAERLITKVDAFRQTVHAYALASAGGDGRRSSAQELESAALRSASEILRMNRAGAENIRSQMADNSRSMLRASRLARITLGLILAGAVIAVFLVVSFMDRSLLKPITALAEGTKRVAEGDLSGEIQTDSQDEMGELARSFNMMVRDLREQKVELTRQKDYVSSIIANMAESLTVATPDGKIQTVNKATCSLLGYEEDQLIGQDINILFDDEDEDLEEGPLLPDENRSAQLGTSFQNYELNYRTRDGRSIPVLFSTSVLRDSSGNIDGLICVAQDITAIKEAQRDLGAYAKKLALSNDELRHFLHIASHDLQEPLRKIKVIGDRLKDRFHERLDASGQDYIERMQRSTVRMQTLINDLLTFSRLSTEDRTFQPVDISSLVRDVLDDLDTKIEETGATVECDELPSLFGDPLQIRQMIHNLIANSLKFRKKDVPPVIRISARTISGTGGNGRKDTRTSRQYQLIFEDNGIGFDRKYAERIFGVFQRLHGKNAYEGTGIGLSICRKIAARHGGQITAQGKSGDGATFIVTLPSFQKVPI